MPRRRRSRGPAAGRDDLLALCLNYLGCAQVLRGDDSGLASLRESLALALRVGDDVVAARAYINIAYVLWLLARQHELDEVLEDGLAFCDVRDLTSHAFNLRCTRAETALLRGRWAEAEALLDALHADVEDAGVLGAVPRRASGVLLSRRGLPGADCLLAPLLEEALEEARQPPDVVTPREPGAAPAVVEWCWLADRAEDCRPIAEALIARVAVRPLNLDSAELARWLLRAGLLDAESLAAAPMPEAFAAGMRGDWRAAAAEWERIGAPYERALELLDSGDVDATLEAIAVLDGLEAAPAARIARRRLRDLGVTRVPRGPTPTTRANPAGLTERQLDVLDPLAEGLTNGEIAGRLVVSTRTVDHHVSAVLAKLGVTSRREAARRAREMRDG